ncbi:hypothetical protein DUNSADRAFT_12354 [Dunaliella salina]|uniref:Protochlorophyllide reductase n=1 Tax=Dunaliella salina TaxID=3046 RepID=A0ABQ7GBK2_DUNSA|nr:hypothetical protein DUNSADRAFT_12354 [Dunaliella salina]|eukprot:KAF5831959.1 hypothetical protein DUNSADRAFT_12354 [Dunaliella salina]
MLHLPQIDQLGEPTPGLTAIVTGPTSGIGKETAAALARRGAKVVLACRSKAKGEALKAETEKECAQRGLPAPSLEIRLLDLASLQSVRAFSEQWEAEARELHILVNNAGIYAMGAPREETCDGFEAHMGCNHLGHFLLTLSLLPSLERGAKSSGELGARVVNVSSSVHMMAPRGVAISDPHLVRKGAYSSELAYGQSKLAQILFTRELRARLQKKGLSRIHTDPAQPSCAGCSGCFLVVALERAAGQAAQPPGPASGLDASTCPGPVRFLFDDAGLCLTCGGGALPFKTGAFSFVHAAMLGKRSLSLF